MTRYTLPRERRKYTTEVEQLHIDKTTPCRMDDCTLYHALIDDRPTKFKGIENVRKIRSTDHGFTFIFEMPLKDKTYKATAIYGTATGKKIYRLDETYLKTRSREKALKTMRPFTSDWWIEKLTEFRSKRMTDEDKKRLRKLTVDQETGAVERIGGHGRARRRGFSLAS
jgi:hypothetical protein